MFPSVSASGVRLVLRHVCRTIYCLSYNFYIVNYILHCNYILCNYILPGAYPGALLLGDSHSTGLVTEFAMVSFAGGAQTVLGFAGHVHDKAISNELTGTAFAKGNVSTLV
jgi:hypothetical protein